MTAQWQRQTGNSDLLRQLNSAAVYRLIDQGAISRIQIAELTRLAPASVSKITRQLLERGLIAEQEQQASTGGRRATSLVCVTRRFHTIAIQLGRKDAWFALYDLSGHCLTQQKYPLSADNQQSLEQTLLHTLDHFIWQNQSQLHQLIAIALTAPGLVQEASGIIDYMPHISVSGWSLRQSIREHSNLNCFIGHDIRSLALAEHYFGNMRDCLDAIFIRVHQGTGAGILSGGEIFNARNGSAGEIGHIQVDPLGKRCHCGNFGCLETIAGNDAMAQRALHLLHLGHPSSLSEADCHITGICQAANRGDKLACDLITQLARYLGQALATAVNLFHPEKVIIAGEITAARDILLPVIRDSLNHQALPVFAQHLSLLCSDLTGAPAIGAFALVRRAMLDGSLLQQLLDNKSCCPADNQTGTRG